MRTVKLLIFLSFLSAWSCANKETPTTNETRDSEKERLVVAPIFQEILDSAQVMGSILLYDLKEREDIYYSNDFEWAKKGFLPASTFKITNSIIALETGVVENDSTLFKWDGQKRRIKDWEQDLIFKQAFHLSCVPCYQEVARKIGPERMKEHLDKFKYGNMQLDSSNIDMFWLQGSSQISQFQQIDFLKRFYHSKLPISKRTEQIAKKLIVIEETPDYKISGKTGWSIREGNNNGWFVGFVEKKYPCLFLCY